MFHSDTHIDLNQPGAKENGPKITKNAVLASLAVSLGSMIVGFCSAWSSPAIASLMEQGSGIEVCTLADSGFFKNLLHQSGVKSTVFLV